MPVRKLHPMGYTIHCTKKLLDRLKVPVSATPSEPTTKLGNWYATALFWKPQVVLLVNERTLLPVLMPLAPANGLAARFPEYLALVLAAHGAPQDLIVHELSAMRTAQCAKTVNRSLVGMLNQFAYLADGYSDHQQAVDLLWLSMHLSETPCSPLYQRAVSPDRELKRLIASDRTVLAGDGRWL